MNKKQLEKLLKNLKLKAVKACVSKTTKFSKELMELSHKYGLAYGEIPTIEGVTKKIEEFTIFNVSSKEKTKQVEEQDIFTKLTKAKEKAKEEIGALTPIEKDALDFYNKESMSNDAIKQDILALTEHNIDMLKVLEELQGVDKEVVSKLTKLFIDVTKYNTGAQVKANLHKA